MSTQVGTQAASCPFSGQTIELRGDESRIDPEIFNNPLPFYRALRTQDPVYFDEKMNMYLVTRYDDCMAVLKDNENFSFGRAHKEAYGNGFAEELNEILRRDGGGVFANGLAADPPGHTRLRRLLEKAFTGHRVKELEPRIRQIVIDLIEPLRQRGYGDGIKDIGVPLTGRIICEQLGFDFNEVGSERIARWSAATLAQMGRLQSREQMLENAKDLCDMQNYIIPQVLARQAEPRADMISDLVHARIEDDENPTLSMNEQVSSVRALLIAGNDTTAASMANLMLALATQPETAKQLYEAADDDRLMTRFVEEVLRMYTPVHGLWRVTTRDVEVGGKVIPGGSQVCIMYASANDDDTRFPDPRKLDVNRNNILSHLTFGAGIHRCIGAALARMEIKVAAQEIIKRLDNIKLAIPVEELTYQKSFATFTVEQMPLTFTPR
jgi:cytochrome P450